MKSEPMLLFDLDGTLWDSSAQVAASWNEVLTKRYPDFPPLTPDDLHRTMGLTMDEIGKRILPELSGKDRSDIFDMCMSRENEYLTVHGGVLFPGVRETLKELFAYGYETAIVSNCQAGYIQAFLTSMKMEPFFCDWEEWGRTGKSKAENIRLVLARNHHAKGIYIGDIERDMLSAREAGVPFIHAAYGFGKVNRPDGVIRTFSELPQAVRNLEARLSAGRQEK